jgi:truncated hemoglobin YjbI
MQLQKGDDPAAESDGNRPDRANHGNFMANRHARRALLHCFRMACFAFAARLSGRHQRQIIASVMSSL